MTDAGAVRPEELTAAGFRLIQDTVLIASEVHAPPRPNTTATYRILAGDEDWQQAARLRAAVYPDGPGGDPVFVQAQLAAERVLTEAGHGSWFGAFTGGTLAAQLGLICGESGLARYQNVETHAAARRQGLAGSLVWQAGQQALSQSRASAVAGHVCLVGRGWPGAVF